MDRVIASLGSLAVVVLLLVASVAGASAGATDPATTDEPMVHVDLSADGDATVSLVMVYEFADADERDAFETLETDEAAREDLLDRFSERLQATADRTDGGDRDATVSADDVDVRTADDYGVVVLSVHWSEFAATDDGELVVTEPFASGYESDRPVVLTAPDGATIDATPEPTDRSDQQATWASGTEFDGFEATISLDSDGATTDEGDALSGFGSVVAGSAVALVLLGSALYRRG